MKVTICGSMRFMPVMMALSGWLKQHSVQDVKIPEDIRPKSQHDEEFTSVLIKRRADHISNIDKSDLVFVVCEPYDGNYKPRIIHSSCFDIARLERVTRDLSRSVSYPDVISSWWNTRATSENVTDVYGCTLGYNIGESTSFELISSLRSRVPVLILPVDDKQWVCYPDTLKVEPDNVYRCDTV